jgi:hypothetical protein
MLILLRLLLLLYIVIFDVVDAAVIAILAVVAVNVEYFGGFKMLLFNLLRVYIYSSKAI